jgi:hypothetical protein
MTEEFNPLAEILEVAKQQKKRVQMMLDKEQEVGMALEATSKAVKDYQDTLALMQKMQIEFDATKKGAAPTLKSVEERVKEAMGLSERMMARHYE